MQAHTYTHTLVIYIESKFHKMIFSPPIYDPIDIGDLILFILFH